METNQKQQLYKELTKPDYKSGSEFYTDDLGEGMSLIHQSICGWWKPRFLLDHRSKEASEFLDQNEIFVQFSEQDVDWESIRDVPGDAWGRARTATPPIPHM